MDVLKDDGDGCFGMEWDAPGRYFVEHEAERLDVAAVIGCVSLRLLR